MSTSIASLHATISADNSGLVRGLNQTERMLSGFGKSFSAFDKIATGALFHVGATIVDTVGKAFEKVGDIASAGIDFNAMQESADTAFTTMLGSAEKAQSFLNEMQSFAKTTPFEYPELLTASRRLMALGFASDEVLPALTKVGDAVAALGGGQEMIDRVTLALGQMKTKGTVQAEEMLQLAENGIPAWEMLAKTLGVDIPTAMKMVEKRQVSSATGIEAIMTGIDQRFGGMMQKQSSTWNGLISNLKDSFGMLSGRVMKPFFDVTKRGLEWLVNLTSADSFNQGVDRLVQRLTRGLESVGNALAWFRNTFGFQLAILTSDNASFGDKLIAVWDMIVQTATKLWSMLAKHLAQMLPEWLNNLGEWATALWEWIKESIPIALEKLWEWASGLWGWIIDNAPQWAAALWNWAVETWTWIVESTPTAVAKLAEWGAALWDWLVVNLPTWASNFAGWAEAAWKWLADVVPIVAGKMVEWGGALFNWLTTNAPTWGQKLSEWGAAAWQWLARVIPEVATQIGNWGTSVLGWLATNTPTWQAKLTEWGRAAWTWLADALPKVAETVGQWGMNVLGWFTENGPTFANIMLSWATWLVKWIGDTAPKAINALASFVQGLRGEGDGNGANKIGQMVAGWAQKLWKWITVDSLPMIAPAFVEFIGAIWTEGGKVLSALGNLALELGTTLWQWIETATPIAWAKLGEWGGALWGWITTNAPVWGARLAEWGRLAWQWIVDVWPTVRDKLAEWGGNIWDWVTTNAPKLGEKLSEWSENAWAWIRDVAIPNTTTWLGNLWTEYTKWTDEHGPEWLQSMNEMAEDSWTWLRDTAVPNTAEWMRTWADIFTNSNQPGMAVVNYLGTTFPFAVNQAVSAWQEAEKQFAEISDLIAKIFGGGTVGGGLVSIIDFALTEMILLISGFASDLGNIITAALLASQGDWEGALDELLEIGSRKWGDMQKHASNFHTLFTGQWETAGSGLQKGFQAGWDKEVEDSKRRVEGFSTYLPTVMKDNLEMRSPSRVFEGFGRNVVEGFEQGFDNRWNQFKNFTSPTVTGWMSWFKGVFGIHSPSAVFEGYGVNIVAGLARGIEGAQGMVYSAMNSLSDGMSATMEPSFAYSGAGSAAPTQSNARIEQLLEILIAELRAKNMNVTVQGGGQASGNDYGSLVSFKAGMR